MRGSEMSPAQVGNRLLVVDDAADTREVLQRNLKTKGYQVFTAASVAEAIRVLESTVVDLVITDLKMPGASGMDLVRHIRENYRDVEVMMITGYPTIEGAVQALKIGAEDFLSKPFTQEELLKAVERALAKLQVRLVGRLDAGRTPVSSFGLVGESVPMQHVFEAIRKAAATSAMVMITGESGTGKELVSRAIHYSSARASAPFLPVNCGGIPQELLESELFGHIKGAFTGASATRAGFFQTAEGGTIFLDEISETSPAMQVKLLRVLQDREVCMVGSAKPRTVDVRVLVATNKDLASLVEQKVFREDLYYRLNVIRIPVPPLRDRGDDVLILARHFAAKFSREYGKALPVMSEKALSCFKNYLWPGNVRELENLCQRLVVMTDGDRIDVPDLPSFMRFSAMREAGLNRPLAQVEAEYIRNVLASVGGNKTRAAEILRIDRKTLREKLKELPSSL
jgi:two-component system, NtrC family, response regulator HydG